MATILRGPVTIYPDQAWTDAAATWPVAIVQRETIPAEYDQDGNHVSGELGPSGLIIALDEGRLELTEPVSQLHLVCGECDQSVFCLSPYGGTSYQVTTAQMTAQILSHLRRSHPDVVES